MKKYVSAKTIFPSEEPVHIRTDMAKDSSTDPDILRQLANDVQWSVRIQVAYNRSTPPEVLAELVNDSDFDVVIGVANNPNTPVMTLVDLYGMYKVRNRYMLNSKNRCILSSLANNPSTPVDILYELHQLNEVDIDVELINNPAIPFRMLASYVSTTSGYPNYVRDSAISVYQRRYGGV